MGTLGDVALFVRIAIAGERESGVASAAPWWRALLRDWESRTDDATPPKCLRSQRRAMRGLAAGQELPDGFDLMRLPSSSMTRFPLS